MAHFVVALLPEPHLLDVTLTEVIINPVELRLYFRFGERHNTGKYIADALFIGQLKSANQNARTIGPQLNTGSSDTKHSLLIRQPTDRFLLTEQTNLLGSIDSWG